MIHHSDLGVGFEPLSWPDLMVRDLLAETIADLAQRCPPGDLAGWVTGRGPAPLLGPWSELAIGDPSAQVTPVPPSVAT